MSDSPQPVGPASDRPRVGLFVTCLVDVFRPNIGFAAVKLLEDAGCRVEVPDLQTCCGQPAYNSGDAADARVLARQVIEAFEGFDYVVGASGSCMGMLHTHYPRLFENDARWRARANALADRCHELLSFLHDVRGVREVRARYDSTVTYHDSCSGLRELGVQRQPRALLASVEGLGLRELEDSNVCCGFGGTFCVKYPAISEKMVTDKANHVIRSGAGTLLGGDLGCLLNMAGRLRRMGSPVRVYHAAEVLAGMTDVPPIGDGEASS
ncbi:MAG: (Fe-S)-binding protein [Ectothiorhodospiraceae bacterium]|nr:(Fe-S)-binding protein [Chromatiales bacterium]MCP5157024.1 (Fe-S)-binding protein [Ectothiorhodospiraceae bacterium]